MRFATNLVCSCADVGDQHHAGEYVARQRLHGYPGFHVHDGELARCVKHAKLQQCKDPLEAKVGKSKDLQEVSSLAKRAS